MSIQWTFIAGFLYFEIAVVMIMILPIFSPRRWWKFFNSRLFLIFRERAAVYFYILLGVLGLFLVDAIREMRKYSNSSEPRHLPNEMKNNVKLFRSQRNFYITGFAIFLAFVIRRLLNMILLQHELQIQTYEIIKKADQTVNLAKTTVLATALQNGTEKLLTEHEALVDELIHHKTLLNDQNKKIKELEGEASKWKQKYEEISKESDQIGDQNN